MTKKPTRFFMRLAVETGLQELQRIKRYLRDLETQLNEFKEVLEK